MTKDRRMVWHIQTVDTHQYMPAGDDPFIRFELRNDMDLTSLEVQLPWSGKLIELMDGLECEVRKRIGFYLHHDPL